jgi:hypothetical protein
LPPDFAADLPVTLSSDGTFTRRVIIINFRGFTPSHYSGFILAQGAPGYAFYLLRILAFRIVKPTIVSPSFLKSISSSNSTVSVGSLRFSEVF